MKKAIKLTQKQEQVLKRYNELLAKHNYQNVFVDEAYVDMTAINPIVGANWFDRTFDALVQKGLLVKVEQEKTVQEGYFEGRDYTDWYWKLTDLGFEYLGIDNLNKPVDEAAPGHEGTKQMTVINREKFFNEVNKWDIYKYLENNFTKEITHHSADVGKNIYEVRFYLDENKKHTFLHCYHDEDGWRDFDYFMGGLLRFVKESEENKEKATEMFRHFDCVESE